MGRKRQRSAIAIELIQHLAGRLHSQFFVAAALLAIAALIATTTLSRADEDGISSPTIDTNELFFFGAGDGSNGYYAEGPKPVQQ